MMLVILRSALSDNWGALLLKVGKVCTIAQKHGCQADFVLELQLLMIMVLATWSGSQSSNFYSRRQILRHI